MSGKYRICSVIVSLLFFYDVVFSQIASVYFLERNYQENLPKKESAPVKQNITINGYTLKDFSSKDLSGLRAKAIGDLLLRRNSNSRSIKYYEMALKNLPNEADIYFNLGNIYFEEKVFNIAGKYYQIAAEKYKLPENHEKTAKYRYLSMIRYGFALTRMRDFDNNQKQAEILAAEILKNQADIEKNYPDIVEEMNRFFRIISGGDIRLIMKNE